MTALEWLLTLDTIRHSDWAWVLSRKGWVFLYRCYRLGRARKPLPLHHLLNLPAVLCWHLGADERRAQPGAQERR